MPRPIVLLLFLSTCLLACGGPRLDPAQTTPAFLLTNLRPHGNKIISTNEWHAGAVLPVCMQVQVGAPRGREIRFLANGVEFRYIIQRRSRLTVQQHYQRVFGPACPDLNTLSEIDRAGIRAGAPYAGMSRGGVIIAMGYPPDDLTPALEQASWTYRGQRGRVTAQFAGATLAGAHGPNQEPALLLAAQPPVAAVAQAQPQPVPGQVMAPMQAAPPQPAPAPAQPEPMVVVSDANGYPVQVPQSAVGRPCSDASHCHPSLTCRDGTCQGAAP